MIASITILYLGLIYLLFYKLKVVKPTTASKSVAAGIGFIGIIALLIAMNLYQPYAEDLRVYNPVVQIVPRVTGRVIAVPVEPNIPLKKGDLLFKVDPRPFEYKVQELKAKLKLAELRVSQSRELASQSAGSRYDVEQYEAEVGGLKALLDSAELDLAESKVYAPSDGYVSYMTLRPGQVASKIAAASVMSFVNEKEYVIVASYPQRYLRHIKVGDRAEIALETNPGKIFNAEVSQVVTATGQGQLPPSGLLPEYTQIAQSSRFPVVFRLIEDPSELNLRVGAAGAAAIFTDKGTKLRIIKKVVIRMYTWMNYLPL